MKKRNLFIGVIMVAAVLAGVLAQTTLKVMSAGKRAAYTIVWQVTDYDINGRGTLSMRETRYVSASGKWRAVRQYVDGRREELFAEAGRGVFVKRGQKQIFLSGYEGRAPLTQEQLLKAPGFVRTEDVLGYPAVVVSSGESSADRVELYRAAALGGNDIKTVLHNEDGSKTVFEPVSLIFGEPEASLLNFPENLPVDSEHFRKVHDS